MRKIKKVPTRIQMEATECGAACLAMILEYYGRYIPLENMREDCKVSRDGSSVTSIIDAANLHGLNAKGSLKKIDGLRTHIKAPAILLWMNCHFVVLEGYKNGIYYINDPAVGRRKISGDDFEKNYSGLVISLEKNKKFKYKKNDVNFFNILKFLIGENTNAIILLFFFSFLLIVPGICIPIFSQIFINQYFIGGQNYILYPLLGIALFVFLLQISLLTIQQSFLIKFSQKLSIVLSENFMSRLFELSNQFYQQRFSGDLIARLESNNTLAELISGKISLSAINLIQIAIYALIMIFYNWQLACLVFISSGISILVYQISKIFIRESHITLQQQSAKQLSTIIGGIKMIETLKSTSSECDLFSRWSGLHAIFLNSKQTLEMKSLYINHIPTLSSSIFNSAVLGLGAWIVFNGKLNLGELIAFQALAIFFTAPLFSIIGLGSQLQAIFAIINRIMDVLNYKDCNKKGKGGGNKTSKLTGKIQIKNITFGYNTTLPPLINSLNLNIYPGQKVALIGPSGSGKSTIGNLILGLIESWEGDVYFDNVAVGQLSKFQFKQSIATVSQDIMLFEGTVRENMTLWGKCSLNDVEKALKDACIYEDIASRPGYLDFIIDESGRNLSGGQKQRLEIARALVTNPSIIMLDEATSALDTITEKKVMDNITGRGCTCIIIAHRLSAIRDCDEIILLESGSIIERGTHDYLFSLGGIYSRMMKTGE